MKTAVQELMELNDFLKIMGVTIEWDKYLEKEKTQIMMAFNDGKVNSVLNRRDSEDYHNQTYKN
jgi:hypothetical protein